MNCINIQGSIVLAMDLICSAIIALLLGIIAKCSGFFVTA